MIHQYKLNGCNIVLDVFSGSIHAVDEVAYEMIALFEEKTIDEIIPVLQTRFAHLNLSEQDLRACHRDIQALKEEQLLFTENVYKDFKPKMSGQSVIKAMCLHVAHTCNLACAYCFAKQGSYRGGCPLMSFETGKRALDFLVEHSGKRRNLEVDFFGGEPLLNWKVVKQLVAYGRSLEKEHNKNFRFTLTTNGVLINDDVIEFSNKEMHNVVLSLDGRKETNDRFRKYLSGKGSYDTIVPKFKKLVEARGGKDYHIRGTFTHYNVDFTKDIFHMADLGFDQLSMEPVITDPQSPSALKEADLPTLLKQYEILAKEMLKRSKEGRPFNFYHYMINLEHSPCIHKRVVGCGAGTEYVAVTPKGDLYPCHQFVNDAAFCLGNIWDGIHRKDIRQEFAQCNVFTRKECNQCWAQLYCSGGCAANSFHATGDIKGIYEYGCELFRKRMECAIMMQVKQQEDEAAVLA